MEPGAVHSTVINTGGWEYEKEPHPGIEALAFE